MMLADLGELDRALLVGSFLRKDQPLVSVRLRHATKHGCKLSVVHAADDDLLMPVAHKAIVRPRDWVRTLAGIATAIAAARGTRAPVDATPDDVAQAIASSLLSGERKAILLGNAASQHPQAAQLLAWAQWIAEATGARVGVLTEAANTVGGHLVGAVPGAGGMNARQMLESPRRAYLLWNLEPDLDLADPPLAQRALGQADTVIVFSPYRNGALEYADAILPIAPFTETAGSFVNCEGRLQTFNGAVQALGESRPGWKVLRVLGNLLGVGFEHESPEQVRAEALPSDFAARLSNQVDTAPMLPAAATGTERIADVPIHFSDAIVRRSPPLQATRDARPPKALANASTLAAFGVAAGDKVQARQGEGTALLEAALDPNVADDVVRIAAAHASTSGLGPMFGPITLGRA
jgi:NADH-quinone oxidoreductase subunit G